MNATALLLDSEGSVGRTYGAKTTPQMFVVSPKGTIIYSGALDSDANLAKEGLATATNYVAQTLDAALSGQKITTASTKPYGCSVKYGH
jgi:DNA-binding beta-propeller fold protein YncE